MECDERQEGAPPAWQTRTGLLRFPGRPGFGRPGRGVLRPAGLRLGVWNWMWRSVLGHAMTL